jgi:hypothetical protein
LFPIGGVVSHKFKDGKLKVVAYNTTPPGILLESLDDSKTQLMFTIQNLSKIHLPEYLEGSAIESLDGSRKRVVEERAGGCDASRRGLQVAFKTRARRRTFTVKKLEGEMHPDLQGILDNQNMYDCADSLAAFAKINGK